MYEVYPLETSTFVWAVYMVVKKTKPFGTYFQVVRKIIPRKKNMTKKSR